MSFATKIEQLQSLLEEFCTSGGELTRVRAEMRQIEALLDQGEFRAAEERLSRLVADLRHQRREAV